MIISSIKKIKLLDFLTILIGLQVCIPYFFHISNNYIGTIFLLTIWNLINKEYKLYTKDSNIFLLLFMSFICFLFSYLFILDSKRALIYSLIPLIYLGFYRISRYYEEFKLFERAYLIFYVLCIILSFNIIYSIPTIFSENILLARKLTSGGFNQEELIFYLKKGIGTTSYYTNLAFLFFILYNSKNKSLLKNLILIIFAIGIITSTFNLPILILILSLIFSAFTNKGFKNKIVIIIFFILLGISFNFLADNPLIEPIARKLEVVDNGDYDKDGRNVLIMNSINTFIENPFFGIGLIGFDQYNIVGNHSSWVDFLAFYGFLGVLPFYTFFVLLFKKMKSTIKRIIYFLFVLVSFINPFLPEVNLAFTLLVLSNLIIAKNENNPIYIRR